MAVKTITIDMDAYELLAAAKRTEESFSRVIKRHFRRTTARDLLGRLDDIALSENSLQKVEEQVRTRRDSPAASPSL